MTVYTEGEMYQKLFGGRAPRRPAGGAHSTPRLPAEFMGGRGNGEGRVGGKDKGEKGGWGKDRRKGREGRE